MKRVEVILGKDGSVKTEAFGLKGPACLKKTQFIRNALGVENDQHNTFLKSSYFEEETEINVNGLPSGHCG